ncbi:hypothetical protein TNCT_366661 [Trichonephila clavata]|uniref:Uncharacterized protein n=1 Tax=Trichonephila clavata TaxID=2740835 RepID=A0A8X6FRX9_TRICU|nr:hypothetical protein TNCT_366661 [Trichonephila clavata]
MHSTHHFARSEAQAANLYLSSLWGWRTSVLRDTRPLARVAEDGEQSRPGVRLWKQGGRSTAVLPASQGWARTAFAKRPRTSPCRGDSGRALRPPTLHREATDGPPKVLPAQAWWWRTVVYTAAAEPGRCRAIRPHRPCVRSAGKVRPGLSFRSSLRAKVAEPSCPQTPSAVSERGRICARLTTDLAVVLSDHPPRTSAR